MKEQTSATNNSVKLQPYLSPLAVWALSVGSAIGWGSLVVTSRSYLSQAGPLGSILGLLIGFAMMLMVSSHYHFLANRYPGTGGLYNYVKQLFGYDFAFLIAWFMFLIYASIFWANATSIPLFARYFCSSRVSFLTIRLQQKLMCLWLSGHFLGCCISTRLSARIMTESLVKRS